MADHHKSPKTKVIFSSLVHASLLKYEFQHGIEHEIASRLGAS